MFYLHLITNIPSGSQLAFSPSHIRKHASCNETFRDSCKINNRASYVFVWCDHNHFGISSAL